MSWVAAPERRRIHGVAQIALLLSCACAKAAAPTLTGVTPFAANPGTTVPVKFAGKLDGSGAQVWCDDPAVHFTPPDASGASTAIVGAGARPGLHLLRFVNAEGATLPVRFAIGPLPLVEEKEPNDEPSAPQSVASLPAWIQGRLEKAGDVDGYSITLKKDVPVYLKVDGYALGSPVDLILHILDPKGIKLATLSDARNLDPEGFFTPPEDGKYTLQIAGFAHPPTADINFTGAATCAYQIAVHTGPVADRVFPAAIPAQGKVTVQRRGLCIPNTEPPVEAAPNPISGAGDIALLFPKDALAPISVLRTKHPILVTPEAAQTEPAAITPPMVVAGALAKAGDSAAYKFTMKKGERLTARFWSRSIGLGIEGDLTVQNPGGQQVAASPNPTDIFSEPSVTWTAAVEGEHTLLVRDLFQRGGSRCEFVIEVAPPAPAFSVELLEGKPVRVEAGKTLSLKAKATLSNGWNTPLLLRASGLPEGVYAAEVPVPEKGGEFEIPLLTASNAPIGTAQIYFSAWTKATPPTFVGVAYPLRGELKRGDSISDAARDLWLTVAAPGTPPAPEADKKKK
jgi:hypothetical protein